MHKIYFAVETERKKKGYLDRKRKRDRITKI